MLDTLTSLGYQVQVRYCIIVSRAASMSGATYLVTMVSVRYWGCLFAFFLLHYPPPPPPKNEITPEFV